MERDEILKKAQAERDGLDEREQQMLGVSFGFGAVLMAALCIVLAAARIFRGNTPTTTPPFYLLIWPALRPTSAGKPAGGPPSLPLPSTHLRWRPT